MHSIYIVENPLMDYVIHADYAFIERFNAKPGTMQLVDHAVFSQIINSSSAYKILPGGSGANTARALAMLIGPELDKTGKPAFSGSIGLDEPGRNFVSLLNEQGIETHLPAKKVPTGVSAIVVTPDHERTMFTYLGACRDFSTEDLSQGFLRECRFFYSTGYMWDTEPQKQALFSAIDTCLDLGTPVCFDVADPFVVDRYYKELHEWLPGRIDILFANRMELSRLTDCKGTDAEIMRCAAPLADVVVMKIGKAGCLVRDKSRLIHVHGETVLSKDTTGAGDSFAAGFLYGLLKNQDIEMCARLGNRIASRIVTVEGVDFSTIKRDDIVNILPQDPISTAEAAPK